MLRLELLRQEEPVEAVERRFEVKIYGKKEKEVIYDPKGQQKKGKKASFNHYWPRQERIHIPRILYGRVVTDGAMAV